MSMDHNLSLRDTTVQMSLSLNFLFLRVIPLLGSACPRAGWRPQLCSGAAAEWSRFLIRQVSVQAETILTDWW